MHGLGNDFMVIDGVNQKVEITPEMAKGWADRHFGVGCDQILLVERSEKADFKYRIWNQDGGEVEQCGNGARCFVRFVHDKGLTDKKEIRVETKGGIISPKLQPDGSVEVDMGAPIFEPDQIPFIGTTEIIQKLDVDGTRIEITALSMGNPHAVQVVDDVDAATVITQGPLVERHERLQKRVNVGYMQIVDRNTIKLRVWDGSVRRGRSEEH